MPVYCEYAIEGDQSVEIAPSTDVDAGQPYEISSGYWGVPAVPVAEGERGSFRVKGVFYGRKTSMSSVYAVGELVDFTPGVGFAMGTTWRVVHESTSLDEYLLDRDWETGTAGTPQ